MSHANRGTTVRRQTAIPAEPLIPSGSVGAAEAEFEEDAGRLLQRADAALYAAKQTGRNRSDAHDGLTRLPITATDNVGARPCFPAG